MTTAAGIGMATESWDSPAVKPSVNGSGITYGRMPDAQRSHFYADKLCVTSDYLSKVVREYDGQSAAKWIINAVITEAKILLREPDKTINQIAIELNFPDQSTFGKFFKRNTGLSPLSTRKVKRQRMALEFKQPVLVQINR